MNFSHMPDILVQFSKPFSDNGFSLYAVGGAVRDSCLGKTGSDYDFTTDARPEDVIRIFKHVIPTGIKHGTVTVLFKGEKFEVTTFRTESGYTDKRHPESVSFDATLEEDLKRRDFTINALAVKLPGRRIIDMFSGLEDLKAGIIRCIGDPADRFQEDALRMLRACRFAASLGFRIENETFDAIKKLKQNIRFVSMERIQEELSRIVMSDNPDKGFSALRESGLLELLLPELHGCIGVEQKGLHHEDVYDHSISTLLEASGKGWSLEVRLASLLHDIGKPACKGELRDGRFTFNGHDIKGSELAAQILSRLKYPNAVIKAVSSMVANHMFSYSSDWTDGAVRRFISRCRDAGGPENVIRLRLADQMAISKSAYNPLAAELLQRIKAIRAPLLTVNSLALTGNDLIAMGLEPGPGFSEIKNFLLEQVLDRPELNNKKDLSEILEKHLNSEKDLGKR
ncbi:MAG: CCA tRNA nucleotidyltransferase [Sphaerochaetaceae bacterium]